MAVGQDAATRRRFIFGAKFVLDLVLMLVVVGFAIWGAGRFGGQQDFSSSGVNSLSSRTQSLLTSLDSDLQITGLYSLALTEIRPFAEKHQARVADLLDLYDTGGRDRVSTNMVDPSEEPARMRELLDRMKAKPAYQAEALPYQEALALYPPLAEEVARLFQAEQATLRRFLEEQPGLQQIRELTVLDRNLQIVLEEADAVKRAVDELQSEDIPRYGQALVAIGSHLDQVGKSLTVSQDWMAANFDKIGGLTPEVQNFFRGAPDRYAQVLKDIETMRAAAGGLQPLELEQAYEQLKAGSVVVVESDEAVRVVPFDDVWARRLDGRQDEDGDSREFTGEQAVSSAILRMTQTERTAVVFVRFAGGPLLQPDLSQLQMNGPLPQTPYSQVDAILQKENFLTAEWDLNASPTPPEVPGAARTIYVVFPPTDPGPQALRNPEGAKSISDDQIKLLQDAVDAGGMAVFLTSWRQPRMPIPGMGGYVYAPYLREKWGVTADGTQVAIAFRLNPEKDEAYVPLSLQNPTVLSTTIGALKYLDHPIVAPLKSLPSALSEVVPLGQLEQLPDGVALSPVIEATDEIETWAVANVNRLQTDFDKFEGTRRYPEDLPAPFPVVLAGEQEGQRVVVIASERFIQNSLLDAGQFVLTGGGIVKARFYPANPDLFVNALHWLTGDADRISVSARRGTVPRLTDLKAEHAEGLKVFLVGIWPGLALLGGLAVWLMRRR